MGGIASSERCRVCVIGGGMVGSATAMHLADAGVDVHVLSSGSSLPSSSDDMSRLIGPGDPAADASVAGFRELERRSGESFWHDAGMLEVVPAHSRADEPASTRKLLKRARQFLSFQEFFGRRGFTAHLTENGRGWMDPRGFCRASRTVAEQGGARWHHDRAVHVDGEQGDFVVTTHGGTHLHAKAVVLALGAFAPLSPGLVEACDATPLPTTMWGKTVYHARISEASAKNLAPMPPLWVWPIEGVPEPTVSYEGAKAGSYFYIFPPVQYEDGHRYLKIGHSPHDPVISTLGGKGSGPEVAPTAEQVTTWFDGAAADASTPLGQEVVQLTANSAEFFERVMGKTFAAEWEGGYATNCVTAKTTTGKRLLEQIAPGLWHQTGCNGAGAAAALAWGEETAQAVLHTIGEDYKQTGWTAWRPGQD